MNLDDSCGKNPSFLPQDMSVLVNKDQLKEKAKGVNDSLDNEVGNACASEDMNVENKNNAKTQAKEFICANTRIEDEIEHIDPTHLVAVMFQMWLFFHLL
jgi:hypothetical protein